MEIFCGVYDRAGPHATPTLSRDRCQWRMYLILLTWLHEVLLHSAYDTLFPFPQDGLGEVTLR